MSRIRSLKIGVSGVRGIVGETLSPQLVTTFAQAFGSFVGRGTILVGRDTRKSGEMVERAVIAGLLSIGCQPSRVGVCPIPSLQYKTKHSNAAGAIAITASHNPVQWNALKFIDGNGLFLNSGQGEELLDIYHQGDFLLVDNDGFIPVREEKEAWRPHLERLMEFLDVDGISKAGLKVAFDCCNGAGSILTPLFLEKLGCERVGINTVPDGVFPHNPEPIPSNLGGLCEAVRKSGADIGFAQDADADRLAIVNEKGEPIGEDYTLVLAVKHVLSRKKGPVVTNLSATKALKDVAGEYGCPTIYTKIGEINVVEGILANGAVIGGEGNGGVILPEIHPCRDSYTGMGLVLELLSKSGKKVSELVDSLPRYRLLREKVECSTEKAHKTVRALVKRFEGENMSMLDGIKISYADGWLHIRPSNTEPILRITAEARTDDAAAELLATGRREIAKALGELG